MNNVMHQFLKSVGILTITVLFGYKAFSQRPDIKSVDKISGSMDELVTIQGSYFGTDATKVAVTFGASKGTVQSVTDQLLEVRVPFGATYHDIALTNLTTGLTGFTRQQFLLNFNGKPPFDLTNLQGQYDFPAGVPTTEGLYDLCMCDFDGDKKVDVATANDNTAFVNIFPNASTPGVVTFPGKIAVNIAS